MKCKKCGLDKPLSHFQRNPRARFGYNQVCNGCVTSKHILSPNSTRGNKELRRIQKETTLEQRDAKVREMRQRLFEQGLIDAE